MCCSRWSNSSLPRIQVVFTTASILYFIFVCVDILTPICALEIVEPVFELLRRPTLEEILQYFPLLSAFSHLIQKFWIFFSRPMNVFLYVKRRLTWWMCTSLTSINTVYTYIYILIFCDISQYSTFLDCSLIKYMCEILSQLFQEDLLWISSVAKLIKYVTNRTTQLIYQI